MLLAPSGNPRHHGWLWVCNEELACLLLDVCDELLEAYPTLDLSDYVDVLTIGQPGPSWFVRDILASATDFVVDIL